ncbi:transcription initiation factor TFIID subunit 3 [Copidosoma floridanum]|uniref:transcription initiation factor TFIID subunit 3 n=1 Tax=Copidosoma floridanum TaxID=29053 RepID=UPI000C6FB669|nr:transcription initiation factor TFIID subunit 3 [Copidosoma floridanum]
MTTQYSRNVLKVVVAQICQTIGWHSIHTTPLEFMVDLMQEYIFHLAKLSQQYSQVLGRCEANLDDLGLAFQDMNIDLQELAEYIKNVEPVPCALSVPKLPIHKENHLNFLKPGSREVVTRPVHVHEHLPAMYPEVEEEYNKMEAKEVEATSAVNQVTNSFEEEFNDNNNVVSFNGQTSEDSPIKASNQAVFKRPGDPVSFDGAVTKRAKLSEESRPLREIHSVIMTTSGYLSTAREGKLPEARTPQQERPESPPPLSPPTLPPPSTLPHPQPQTQTQPSTQPSVPEVKAEKKIKRTLKKTEDGKPENKENKKRKTIPKDTLFQPDEIKDVKTKKFGGTKDVAKVKGAKSGAKVISSNLAGPSNIPISGKLAGTSPKQTKNNVSKIKVDKSDNLSNLSIPFMNERKDEPVDKLPIEPDKQKLNIFKKISSKPKEDKDRVFSDPQHKLKEAPQENLFPNVTDLERYRVDPMIKQEDKKPILPQNSLLNNNLVRASEDNVMSMMSPGSDGFMFDMSPSQLRVPSTPKTPELSVPNPVMAFDQQKKKRKEKGGKKKEPKIKAPKNIISPKKARLSNDSVTDLNMLDRPKTPQAPDQMQPQLIPPPAATVRDQSMPSSLPFPFFPPFPTAPGLIPHPMFPLPLAAKGLSGIPSIPGAPNPAMMLGQRFFRPKLECVRPPLVPPSFIGGDPPSQPHPHQQQLLQQVFPAKQAQHQPLQQLDKLKTSRSPDKEPKLVTQPFHFDVNQSLLVNQPPVMSNVPVGVPTPLVPITTPSVASVPLLPSPALTTAKPSKLEKNKNEKKSKEHKKEKKDKLKKKKEKKEKHKEKGEKLKEKKDKSEKKEKLEKIREKKEKKEKRKEKELNKKMKEEKIIESVPKLTLKLGPAGGSPRPPTPDNALMKKITIKPPKKPEDEIIKREPTPELARISPLVTRPPKQKSKAKADAVAKKDGTKEDKENGGLALTAKSAVTVDASGRTVWICPTCGKQDDGSPMIGCDDCDAWYHWVCVGIQVAPADNEDWYCRMCIVKKQEQYQDKKKKKRKKKMKVSA